AVGVDYSMFYLRREREERARGTPERASLEAAAATSGRAVLVSGITVIIAMAGMYLAGAKTFTSFATGTILVVAIAVVGSLTVLPAVLATLGDRVNKLRIPFLAPERRTGESRFWTAILDRVLRHPVIAAAASIAVLLVLAAPALQIHTATPGVETLPRDLPVMRTYDKIQAAFPGSPAPAEVVLHGPNGTSFESQAALRDLTAIASRTSGFKEPITINRTQTNTAIAAEIPLVGDGTDAASERALAKLRDELIPQTVGRVDGLQADVTGITASSKDFNDLMKQRVPIVFAFVLGLAFLLLLVTFRSIVIPIKAILLNLLSVSAAYGVITWVFQEGHLESALGFRSTGSIVSWLPLFMFVILFGLSMDYHVFILTRIREAYDNGMRTNEAVAHGIKSTAAVVTSAAVVMVAVFAIFASLSQLIFKQVGVGLAVAVLIDATIIRALLLPAAMTLLGDWNWYLPRWLEWLPRVTPEPVAAPAAGGGDGAAPFAVPEETGEGGERERVGGRG
ncbi:MAG: MMPL family transporter, partial [Nocardioidaceae bacterium]